MKKRILSVLCAAVLACTVLGALSGCTPRGEVLKIYLPGEYMDPQVYKDFSAWYLEQTGEKVTVKETAFEDVEDILRAVNQDKSDFDLLCPSDYMIEYLIRNKLVLPVDKARVDVNEVIKSDYLDVIRENDPTLEYAVPYMYGTMGIMYDYRNSGEHIDSWEAVMSDKYSGKVYLKDSLHDTYVAAGIYAERDTLSSLSNGFKNYGEEYKTKLQEIFEDTSDAMINKAMSLLSTQSSRLIKWDVEDAKYSMALSGSTAVAGLFWSCDAGYVMNDYEDVNGNMQPGNKNLWYVVPKEGGNVYVDGFVISKYAENTKAANYFLEYLCKKDVAVQNSDYCGAISTVAAAYDELKEYYEGEADGMFDGVNEDWKKMYIDMLFPSAQTLSRCGIMKDFGDRHDAVAERFVDVVSA